MLCSGGVLFRRGTARFRKNGGDETIRWMLVLRTKTAIIPLYAIYALAGCLTTNAFIVYVGHACEEYSMYQQRVAVTEYILPFNLLFGL